MAMCSHGVEAGVRCYICSGDVTEATTTPTPAKLPDREKLADDWLDERGFEYLVDSRAQTKRELLKLLDQVTHARTPGYRETCPVLVGMDRDEICGVHPGEMCPYDTPEDCPTRSSGLLTAEVSEREKAFALALEEIRDFHLGDCPAAQNELAHAKNHISEIRRHAYKTLSAYPTEGKEDRT